jgi:flagellar hook-associated protein 3 FlgL
MDTSFTSTKSFADASRLTLMKLQTRLTIAQKEVASGRYADVGLSLGSRTGHSLSLRRQLAELKGITDTNSTASTRLDSTLSTLKGMTETAQKFISTLITARNTSTGPAIAKSEAKANVIQLIDNLNSSMGGEYLFSGINSGQKPVNDYYATATSSAKQAVDTAFVMAFGAAQSDPIVTPGISETDMQTFLDGNFDSLFQPGASGWDLWSNASDENMQSRVSTNETIETSSTANLDPYRQLPKAYTMVADLGVDTLNQSAFHVVVDTAMQIVGEAIQSLSEEQSRLGTAQARVANANQRMSLQLPIITDQINAMETVDPYEASTRVTTLMTQMEVAYSLTARIQKLSILNYL